MKALKFLMGGVLCASLLEGSATLGSSAPMRDGKHDFDFLFGTWKSHYKVMKPEARLTKRANDPREWYEFDGVNRVRPLMDGAGNLDDGTFYRPTGTTRAITLRLYSAKMHQWSLYWATADAGLGLPAQVGRFDEHGVGDFLADDTWNGKPVIVRYHWTHSAKSWHFEQSFSADHGKTWEVNWISQSIQKVG